MPVCPKCGAYHKKSHHQIRVKYCVGGDTKAAEHMRVSKSGAGKEYPSQKKYKSMKIGDLVG